MFFSTSSFAMVGTQQKKTALGESKIEKKWEAMRSDVRVSHGSTSLREPVFTCRLAHDRGPFSLCGVALRNALKFNTSSEGQKDLLFLIIFSPSFLLTLTHALTGGGYSLHACSGHAPFAGTYRIIEGESLKSHRVMY